MTNKPALVLVLLLGFVLLAMLVSACGTEPATEIPTATATAPAADAAVEPESTGAPAVPEAAGELVKGGDGSAAVEAVEAVAERTPVPTATPGPVERQVDDLVQTTGLAGRSFLGLTAADWINVALSLLIVLLGYLIGTGIGVKLLVGFLKLIVRRTATGLDDAFLDAIETQLKWLVMLLVVRFALLRLDFLSEGLRAFIVDVYLILVLGIIMAIVLKLINVTAGWYRDEAESEEDGARRNAIILFLERLGQVLVIVVGVSIGLSHFGINITALSAALVLIAVVISLGARDIISDAISGFIILLDQPFRVGDVIAIQELNRWGDVVDIGTRTTRMRTRDNRFVTIPNSKIAASQVVNYTFPDPRFRVQVDIRIAYGTDFDQVQRVVEAAVRGAQGVVPDQPVDVLFREYGDSARTMRVRWWIDDMHQEWRIVDRVNVAVERALAEAGIGIPFSRYDLNVRLKGDKASLE
jgi:small-conductance mechanosensitive channel